MSEINRIEQQLSKASDLRKQMEEAVSNAPNDFALSLSATSINNHIEELQKELSLAKKARLKEVVELRLKGHLVNTGSIPLTMLSRLSDHFSNIIYSASYKLLKGKEAKGKIPLGVTENLNLRLEGVAFGSSRLLLSGNINPDIFGRSLFEDSLEYTFALLNSTDEEQLIESAHSIGVKGVRNLAWFLNDLTETDTEIDITWDAPDTAHYFWEGTRDKIISIGASLNSLEQENPEKISYYGEVSLISINGKFDLKLPDGKLIHSYFPMEILDSIKEIHIGDQVECVFELTTIKNRVTEKERKNFSLISIKPFE